MKFTRFLLLAVFVIFNHFASADCNRHIYNYSNQPWTFEFFPYRSKAVELHGLDCITGKVCTIPAGQRIEIVYSPHAEGTLRIVDFRKGQKDYYYYDKSTKCPRIYRDADSRVLVNDPAIGDIKVPKGADHW